MYNSSHSVMQYCNGSDWIPMWGTNEKDPVGGGSGASYPECTITSGQLTTIQQLVDPNLDDATSIAISGNTIFVGTQANNKLVTIDVTNPASMKIQKSLNVGTTTGFVTGTKDWVATSAGSLDNVSIINVKNPANTSVASTISATYADNAGGFVFLDNNTLAISSFDDDRVMIFSVSAAGATTLLGSVTNATTLDGVTRLVAKGNYIYASVRTTDRLTIIDASNRASPVIVGSVTDTRIDDPAMIDIRGNYVYVPSRVQNRLNVIDVSNPASPSIVGSLQDALFGAPEWVVVRGKYAFLGSWANDRVLVVDVSNPASPTLVDNWVGPTAVSGIPAFKGSTMFIGSYDASTSVYSVDLGCDPEPELEGLSSLYTGTCPAGYAYNRQFNSCYRQVTTYHTWSAAEANCVTLGGHLAYPGSLRESAYIASFQPSVQQWLGLNDISVENTFVWSDGTYRPYTNWASGEPNSTSEDCAEITVDGQWNDGVCTLTRPYVCQAKPTFPDITCDPGYYFVPNAMKCIKTTTSPGTWPATKTACEADGAQMPIILSDKKNDAYMDLGMGRFWIGLNDAASEQYWQWINGMDGGQTDGDRDSYVNWFPGEPDGDSDYVNIYNISSRQWDDGAASDIRICEKDPEEICNPEHFNVREAAGTNTNNLTITSYAVPDVENRILFVTANEENANTTLTTPTTATFNGIAMTRIATSNAMLTNNNSAAIFYLLNPPAVTGNIVVNFSGTATSAAIFASVVNCLAQQAPEAFTTNTFTNATETGRVFGTNITTLSDNAFLIDSIASSGYGDFRALETDQQEPNSYGYNSGGTTQMAMGSRIVGRAGSYAMSWYHPASSRFPHVIAAFETAMGAAMGDNLGNHAATMNVDMNTFKVANVATPTAGTDGATKAYVDSVTGSAETDPKVGAVTNNKFCRGDGTKIVCDQDEPALTSLGKYAVFADQQTNNTDGGTPTAAAWTDRVLNTSLHNTIGASLSSNQVTLPAGRYYIDAVVPFQRTNKAKARLVTAANAMLIPGTSVYCTATAADGEVTCYSHIQGVITLGSSTAVKIQYYVQTSSGSMGLGDAAGIGSTEQYTTMMVQKLD